MPRFRAFFRSAVEAQAAADAAIERMTAAYLAAATEAGAQAPTAAPTTAVSVLSVDAVPAGSVPEGSVDHSLVAWSVATPDGAVARFESVMPTAQAPAPRAASATVSVELSGVAPTLRIKARLPSKVQVTGIASGSIAQYTQLEDIATGKKYRTTDNPTSIAVGLQSVNVEEVSSSVAGNVSHGTPLVFTNPPACILSTAPVIRMAAASVPAGTTLTDTATGKTYETTALGSLPGTTDALSGDDTVDVAFMAHEAGGAVAVGTALTFDSTPAGVADAATVVASPTRAIASGAELTRSGRTYTTTSSVTIGDATTAEVGIVASSTSGDSNLTIGDTLTLSSPPSDVSATATVTAATPAAEFPFGLGRQVFGEPPKFQSRVKREVDGRYSATVFTFPPGT